MQHRKVLSAMELNGIINVISTITNKIFLPLKSNTEKENAQREVTSTPRITVLNVTKELLNIARPKFRFTRIS